MEIIKVFRDVTEHCCSYLTWLMVTEVTKNLKTTSGSQRFRPFLHMSPVGKSSQLLLANEDFSKSLTVKNDDGDKYGTIPV